MEFISLDMNFHRPLILGSNSPRRKQILTDAGYSFTVRVSDADESFSPHLSKTEIPEFLAYQKALVLQPGLKEQEVLITSDTIVYNKGLVLNKPADHQEAFEMIKSLSGVTHEVVTGVSICDKEKTVLFHDIAEVTFRTLKDNEINYYIENFKPYDKAGAYGIQEWIGMIGIARFNGSFYTVMGLPIHRVYEELGKFSSE